MILSADKHRNQITSSYNVRFVSELDFIATRIHIYFQCPRLCRSVLEYFVADLESTSNLFFI